eukprot:scaffold87860_cov101-Cyclotella_meneghiniana.AAC.2
MIDDPEKYWATLDGVNKTTYEFGKDPNAKHYDHQSHGPDLKYLIAVSIHRPRIVFTYGPVPAAVHDINITAFRLGTTEQDKSEWDGESLYHLLPPGKKCVGDSGFGGEPSKILVKNNEHSADLKRFIERVLSRHESVN